MKERVRMFCTPSKGDPVMRFFTANDSVNIHYADKGAGRPLVFIHGWSFCGAVWKRQVDCFSGRYRCVVPDLRGHGDSDAPSSRYDISDLAGDVSVLLSFLELREVVLVGWSMGVLVALSAHAAVKERLAGMVFISGTPRFTATDDFSCALPPEECRGLALRFRRNREKTLADFRRKMFSPLESPQRCLEAMERNCLIGKPPDTGGAIHSLDSLATADLRSVLPGITVPVLLVHGAMDCICLPGASRHMADVIPCSSLCVLDDAGHAPVISMHEELNSVIDSFLEGVYGSD